MNIRAFVTLWAIASIPFLFGSCKSATERIAASSEEIRLHSGSIADTTKATRDLAKVSGNRFDQIESQARSDEPDLEFIAVEAEAGSSEQSRIVENSDSVIGRHAKIVREVSEVTKSLTGVQDITPWWAKAVTYLLAATSVMGVCFLIWYTGVGSLVRGWLGLVTPKARREAEIAAAALDTDDPTTMREFVAAKRGLDPEFDRAFRKYWKGHRAADASPDPVSTGSASRSKGPKR